MTINADLDPAYDNIVVRRGNDLILTHPNENGDYSEPLWLASTSVVGGRTFHGRTPEEARERCRKGLCE